MAVTDEFSMAGSRERIEERLPLEHRQADVEPDHVAPGAARELGARLTKLPGADDEHVRRRRAPGELAQQKLAAIHAGRDAPLPVFRPEQPQEHRRYQHERDHRQHFGLDHVEEVQHDRGDRGQHAGDGVPLDLQQAVHQDGPPRPGYPAAAALSPIAARTPRSTNSSGAKGGAPCTKFSNRLADNPLTSAATWK